ncbi:histidine phosphatase family protein [Anianabacter salinae]|uniref:histidine phosphatase family protein n=1 Tax=Anianabacter salinae TaxID=2851023 RepID=UPI00225E5B10|nr:histidine phosphatase family protein [Anianabacter salinae]MBV0913954.1 histidine phosphatase family protein [Anianabacter salinae]
MTRLFLVRHGPTHAKGMVGWSDIPADLSDTNRIARLSRHLPDRAALVSSDLGRARATAEALGAGRSRLPDDPALREINFGDWELRRFDEIEADDPDRIRAFYEHPGALCAPNGECWDDIRARVDPAIDRLIRDSGPDIVVVAHMGVILGQLQRALGVSAYEAFSHRIDPLSVTEIVHDGGFRTGRINHCP